MKRNPFRALLRRLRPKVAAGNSGRSPGPDAGGAAGVREPRRPLPPDNLLHAAEEIPPDPRKVDLPDARQ
ncbi:hypothetical protein [Nocardia sp. NPDC052566]|uniref:hypothetical protein n=1 Tax=Nocardia sp. NPDC052566 TaxID=3364330 RepID=UPI0037CA9C77